MLSDPKQERTSARIFVLIYLTTLVVSSDIPLYREDVLNVHLVPHTHDDVGWLKTVDQYFTGANFSIQNAAVQYILDTVVRVLLEDPSKRFMYVETAFLKRWWDEQPGSLRQKVRQLVQEGRLEIVNGGWCMHDEAAPYYTDMIDQTTLGHRFLWEELGVVPRVGWQIDPFGHSAVQGYLMGAEMGFDAMFFGRIDLEDLEKRRKERSLQMVWRASTSLGASADMWTGVFGSGNYGPPTGFDFEATTSNDPPIQDDERLHDYNVQERVDAFVEVTKQWASWFQGSGPGGHLMYTMGSDFQYSNAFANFKQMDKLIKHVNADGRLNVFYSTPSQYVTAINAANLTYPLKTDDFFPYADNEQAYWTGYFSSRPAFKHYVRIMGSYLQAARQLELVRGFGWGVKNETGDESQKVHELDYVSTSRALEQAVAVAQHHDAVSGTAKQHTTDDYIMRISAGAEEAGALINSMLGFLLKGGVHSKFGRREPSDDILATLQSHHRVEVVKKLYRRRSLLEAGAGEAVASGGERAGPDQQEEEDDPVFDYEVTEDEDAFEPESAQQSSVSLNPGAGLSGLKLEQCPLLNVSVCRATESLPASGAGAVAVVLYNPLAWPRKEVVRVPVQTIHVEVLHDSCDPILSQLIPLSSMSKKARAKALFMREGQQAAPVYELVFRVAVPPLGYSTYFIRRTAQEGPSTQGLAYLSKVTRVPESGAFETESHRLVSEEVITMKAGGLVAHFSRSTGRLQSLHNTADKVTVQVSHELLWYNASTGNHPINPNQGSGAYVFRPNSTTAFPMDTSTNGNLQLSVVEGPVVVEMRQQFADWASMATRIYRSPQGASESFLEQEWAVGPIPIEDGMGKEVISRFSTNIASEGTWYTDSNGRDMQTRKRNSRPTWDIDVQGTVFNQVAGNYYPLNAVATMRDEKSQLSIATDRSQGVASLKDGEMEVMLHRRLLADDHRGVGENLNETACGCTDCECPGLVVFGRHAVMVGRPDSAAWQFRTMQQYLNSPLVLAFGAISAPAQGCIADSLTTLWSMIEYPMPPNVHILTLQELPDGIVLLRLAHLYESAGNPGWDSDLSENAEVDICTIFPYQKIVWIEERTLSANQPRNSSKRLRWQASTNPDHENPSVSTDDVGNLKRQEPLTMQNAHTVECGISTVVHLREMEIRTFYIRVQ